MLISSGRVLSGLMMHALGLRSLSVHPVHVSQGTFYLKAHFQILIRAGQLPWALLAVRFSSAAMLSCILGHFRPLILIEQEIVFTFWDHSSTKV